MFNIIISPIKAVLHELSDDTANFIFLSSDQKLNLESKSNLLLLNFFDTENPEDPRAFNRNQAFYVKEFIISLRSDSDLFVCCDAGMRRSPAVAAAIRRWEGQDDMAEIWMQAEYTPNCHVYRLLCYALGVPVSEKEIDLRKEINREAYIHKLQRR